MALELLVQEQPPEIRVPFEAHAVHVPDFALHPVGGRIEIDQAVDLTHICGHPGLDPHPPVPGHRIEVVDDLEARLLLDVVDTGEVRQHLELEIGVVPKQARHVHDPGRIDLGGRVTELGVGLEDRIGERLQEASQRLGTVILHQDCDSVRGLRGSSCRSYSARRKSRRRLSSGSGTNSCSFLKTMDGRS